MEILYSVIILSAVIIAITTEIYHSKLGISASPIGPKMRRVMLDHCPDKVEGTIIEPGFGWGGNVMALARKYPDNKIIGYELSPFPYVWTRMRVLLSGRKNIHLYRKDFFADSYAEAGLVFVYLTTWLMEKLESKLRKELSPKATVVAGAFKFKDWVPEKRVEADRLFLEIEVFVYKNKAKNAKALKKKRAKKK